ncbi:MAG: GH92 family glycosyl hydrolase [Bacteroidetes bacterium]|nr:GH92 family glycosyl hydrolase [Bacteroidota bacterium]
MRRRLCLWPIAIPWFSMMAQSLSPVDLVDPFIGTDAHGHTFPGATVPFGMVQLSPDTRVEGWDACGGYHSSDSSILGFSHTHLSGTGVGDYGDVLFAPTVGPVLWQSGSKGTPGYRSQFRHASESASPGYYRVTLDDHGTLAELTAGRRIGVHRYTFPDRDTANILIDLVHGIGPDVVLDAFLKVTSDREVIGMRRSRGWANDQMIYFVAQFSRPFDRAVVQAPDEGSALPSSKGTKVKGAVRFLPAKGRVVTVRVGISAVDIEGARKNLSSEPGSFDDIRRSAREAWSKALGRVEVDGGTKAQQRTFFTALYHTMIAPNVFSDADGRYRGMDGTVRTATDFERYTVFSLWDTFRAAHPLFTILEPERTNEFIRSFLSIYEEGGTLPVWELAANETWCMIGYHAVPVITDAYAKGIRGFDADHALRAMQASANKDHFGLSFYRVSGYVPADKESESVSKTLEYAYDDWCIAEMARLMGKRDVEMEYLRRSQNYRNLFDPSVGFMRPKHNGGWLEPFRPLAVTNDFTEANAWQYTFFAPHDAAGLQELYAGRGGHAAKLDEMFATQPVIEGRQQADITGLIGQYAHGNEPSHHIAYLYAYLGQPWKTQQRVRQIMDDFYTDRRDGLIGNEDCGQMSAWYVLSAMGFYPVNPGQPIYVLGAPLFSRMTIALPNGRSWTVLAEGAGTAQPYVRSTSLNGRSISRSWITHDEIVQGGALRFTMSREPHTGRGTAEADLPPVPASVPIALTPVVAPSRLAFADSLVVTLSSGTSASVVRYTLDGLEPTTASTRYDGPITLSETSMLKARAFAEGRIPSGVMEASFRKTSRIGTMVRPGAYSPQYTAAGRDALIDGVRGVEDFRVGGWQGYEGNDLEAVIDLGAVRSVRRIAATFLQDNNAWIFFPTSVRFEVSTDGESYRTVFEGATGIAPEQEGAIRKTISTGLGNERARHVRVRATNVGVCPPWHKGSGNKAWLFVDEVEVED